jgi:hypothetical protein
MPERWNQSWDNYLDKGIFLPYASLSHEPCTRFENTGIFFALRGFYFTLKSDQSNRDTHVGEDLFALLQ